MKNDIVKVNSKHRSGNGFIDKICAPSSGFECMGFQNRAQGCNPVPFMHLPGSKTS